MKPPLVIFHTSFLPYLPFSLWQTSRANPGRELILLGDETNRIPGIPYRHETGATYREKNGTFLQAYRHITRSDFHDERRCLERWFILSEFLEKNRVQGFYFLDSDYLLFADLSKHEDRWISEEAAGTPLFWGFAYFRSPRPIHDFCQWLLELYRDEPRFTAMRRRYEEAGSGLQEMGFIREFCRESSLPIRNLSWRDTREPVTFDDGFFGSSFHYHPKDFSGLCQQEAGGPVWTETEGQRRTFLGMHFIGHSKNQIPGFTGWFGAVARSFFRPNYRRNLKWLCQYAWVGHRCRRQLQRQAAKGPHLSP